jgi:hypothetical protein
MANCKFDLDLTPFISFVSCWKNFNFETIKKGFEESWDGWGGWGGEGMEGRDGRQDQGSFDEDKRGTRVDDFSFDFFLKTLS